MKMKVTNSTGETKIYTVGERTYSRSRGHEYFLLDELSRPVRVCRWVDPRNPVRVTSSGETLELIRD